MSKMDDFTSYVYKLLCYKNQLYVLYTLSAEEPIQYAEKVRYYIIHPEKVSGKYN